MGPNHIAAELFADAQAAGSEEGDKKGGGAGNDNGQNGEHPSGERDLPEQEDRGDQGTKDHDRGELDQLSDEFTELFKLVPEPPPCSGHRDTGGEGGQEEVGVGGVAGGQHQQADGHRQQRLKGFGGLQER